VKQKINKLISCLCHITLEVRSVCHNGELERPIEGTNLVHIMHQIHPSHGLPTHHA
jgi:hypothetical protein